METFGQLACSAWTPARSRIWIRSKTKVQRPSSISCPFHGRIQLPP